MRKEQPQFTVKQDTEAPVPEGVLAQAIVDMSKAMTHLLKSGLNRRAIVVLIAHDTKVPMRTVGLVLDSIRDLAKNYT